MLTCGRGRKNKPQTQTKVKVLWIKIQEESQHTCEAETEVDLCVKMKLRQPGKNRGLCSHWKKDDYRPRRWRGGYKIQRQGRPAKTGNHRDSSGQHRGRAIKQMPPLKRRLHSWRTPSRRTCDNGPAMGKRQGAQHQAKTEHTYEKAY